MALTQKSDRHYTYADYLTWPADERWEIIDGVAYAMTPAPRRIHQAILGEFVTQVTAALRNQTCRAYGAPFDVRLPEGQEADAKVATVVQPDLVVVCDPAKLDDAGCRGAPDWVVEILSSATASHDQIEKLALYARHGVKEYWTAHPTDRVVTVWLLDESASRFKAPEILEGKGRVPVTTLPGLEIDLDLAFAAS